MNSLPVSARLSRTAFAYLLDLRCYHFTPHCLTNPSSSKIWPVFFSLKDFTFAPPKNWNKCPSLFPWQSPLHHSIFSLLSQLYLKQHSTQVIWLTPSFSFSLVSLLPEIILLWCVCPFLASFPPNWNVLSSDKFTAITPRPMRVLDILCQSILKCNCWLFEGLNDPVT